MIRRKKEKKLRFFVEEAAEAEDSEEDEEVDILDRDRLQEMYTQISAIYFFPFILLVWSICLQSARQGDHSGRTESCNASRSK